MITNGAYIELKPGDAPPFHSESRWAEGELHERGPGGLDVTWWGDYPEKAQVFLAWEPRVFAVWEDEHDDGGEQVEQPGEGVPGADGSGADGHSGDDGEAPEDAGSGGEGAGEVPVARPEEPVASE